MQDNMADADATTRADSLGNQGRATADNNEAGLVTPPPGASAQVVAACEAVNQAGGCVPDAMQNMVFLFSVQERRLTYGVCICVAAPARRLIGVQRPHPSWHFPHDPEWS
nr:hypothetical protein [Pandoravirus massiliensis]